MVNTEIRLTLFFAAQDGEPLIQSVKTRLGTDCGSDHKLLIANFRLKLDKIGKTNRPLRTRSVSRSVFSDSAILQTLACQIFCSWNSPKENTGVGCHPYSRGSSQARGWAQVFPSAGRFFTVCATREALKYA